MSDPAIDREIIDLTQRLLDAIADGDWDTYAKLCDDTLTCFEPEARGHLVQGMAFHKFYFDNLSHRLAVNTTIVSPHVRIPGENVALISYVRLQQRMSSDGVPATFRHEETRVWQRQDGQWKHVHFHRSAGTSQ